MVIQSLGVYNITTSGNPFAGFGDPVLNRAGTLLFRAGLDAGVVRADPKRPRPRVPLTSPR